MKRITYLVLLLCMGNSAIGLAQNNFDGFSKLFRYEGDTFKRADIIDALTYSKANNNLYFALRSSQYSGSPFRTFDVLCKVDVNGNVLKTRVDSIDGFNTGYNYVWLSKDGHSLFWAGWKNKVMSDTSQSLVLLKTDLNLNTIWKRVYATNYEQAFFIKIIEKRETGLIYLLGMQYTSSQSSLPEFDNHIYLFKMDTSGHLLSETVAGPNVPGNGKGMVATDDDNLIISGKTRGGWGHNNAVFSMKVDTAGNEIWHTFFGQSAYSTSLCNTIKLDNGTIVNVGAIVPVHMVTRYTLIGNSLGYINKVGANSHLVWQKQIEFYGISDEFRNITKGLNGDLILCGDMQVSDSNFARGWIVGLNKDGEVKWSRKVSRYAANGGHDYLYNVVALKDGSFVAAGSSDG